MKFRRLITGAATAALVLGASLLGPAGAAAQPAAAAEVYVALGDSYSSGVGAGNYDSGSGNCKRSANAYPQQWAAANSPSAFHFTACSGARTTDVLANQLGPLNSSTTLVSISIGGNDAGFADAMQTCVLQSTASCVNRMGVANNYISNTLPAQLDSVYSEIRSRAPQARVVVLGYPRIYQLNGSCVVGISEQARGAINNTANHLSDITSKRAADHGFSYGDVRSAFTGHEICSSSPWLHSVTFPIGDSYHPTAAGQTGGYLPVFASHA
ncbi:MULTISPECIES: SGNH/GDSL hydrolase family protein [unclassified Streptomyces]|uniref:SGNH/GDSL hydrolase family protein n=1 Tax=unclassified Streptomyces TaxID=2593676 RepID=UPI000CD5028F|nr:MULTISPECIES: SGNH/GDSL hydrolase family protein [unclassified Streptomyces]